MPLALATLLAAIIKDSGLSKQDFADEMGLTGSALSHLLNPKAHYSLSVESCLRIARKSGTPPSTLLRAAGKGAVADYIEAMYGPAAGQREHFAGGRRMTPADDRFWTRLRALHRDNQRAVRLLVDSMYALIERTSPTVIAAHNQKAVR